ncbi:MAG: hypothetical protein ACK4WC_13650, partial [Rubrimonas sp.]
ARAGLLGEDARGAERLVQALVEVHARAANQPPIFAALAQSAARADALSAEIAAAPGGLAGRGAVASARAATAQLEPEDAARVEAAAASRVQALLNAVRAAFAALPESVEGLQEVGRMAAEALGGPMAFQLSPDERVALRDVAVARAEAIAPAALEGFREMLLEAPEGPDGLEALKWVEGEFVFGDGPVWEPYRQAVAARRDVIVAAMVQAELPALDAELAALPESREGLAQAVGMKLALDRITGAESAAYQPMADRAAARAQALRASLAQSRCAAPLAAARLSASQAAQPVMVGPETVTLADVLCALAAASAEPPRYEAPGFFGSEHRLDFVGPEGFLIRIVLQEAEVRPGVKALVGKRIEDPAQRRDISASEWTQFIGTVTDLADGPACERLSAGFDGAAWAWDGLLDCLVAFPNTPLPKG